MPIEVHCPNPICARVHAVKTRYAGMRGKCPACGSWMYVPRTGFVPSMAAPRPEGLEESASAWKNPPPAARADKEEVAAVVFDDDEPRAKGRRAEAVLDEEAPEAEVEVEGEKPRRLVSWLATILVLLGMLSLGAFAATPYLEEGRIPPSGVFAHDVGSQRRIGIDPEHGFYITCAGAAVAAGALLCLLAALVGRGFGFVSLFLLYLTTIASAGLLFYATFWFRGEMNHLAKLEKSVAEGDITINRGQQLYAFAGGAGGACLTFLLAAVLIHRRWWSRLLGFLFLGFFIALGPVWNYRTELGIDGYVPAEIEKMIPL
jgi:hypothetical protein